MIYTNTWYVLIKGTDKYRVESVTFTHERRQEPYHVAKRMLYENNPIDVIKGLFGKESYAIAWAQFYNKEIDSIGLHRIIY